MPRESRRMSSRSKRRIDRNVALSSIREMLRNSSISNRYSPFSRDTPRKSPSFLKSDNLRINESSVFTLTPRNTPELTAPSTPLAAPQPYVQLSQNHVTPPVIKTSENENPKHQMPLELATAPAMSTEQNIIQSSYQKLIQHGIQYMMVPIHLLQFCMWRSNAGAILPQLGSKNGQSTVPASESVQPIPVQSASAQLPPQPCGQFRTVPLSGSNPSDIDYSSDESSDEGQDDSSNDQWSTASSNAGLMNMSVDAANNNFEKYTNFNLTEEPMEVTVDEQTSLTSNVAAVKLSPKPRYIVPHPGLIPTGYPGSECSSGSGSEYRWSDGVSSVDSEIAGIFARACTSSSSSDEDVSDTESERNAALHRKRYTPVTYKKQSTELSPRTPPRRKSAILRKRDSPLLKSAPGKMFREKLSSPTDSAYSDEEGSMSFHESCLPVPSIPVVESMDQDVNYGADSENSNDGRAAVRPRMLSYGVTPVTHHIPSPPQGNAIHPPPGSHLRPKPSVSNDQGFDKRRDAVEEMSEKDKLRRWSDTFSLDKSMLHLQIARNSSSKLPVYPQLAPKTVCSCGNPACYPVPVGVPQAPNSQSLFGPWSNTDMYPPAPTPLPHLYYQYPEFMTRPTEQLNSESATAGVPSNPYDVWYQYMSVYNKKY